jgi:hypothetical protein
MAAFVRFVFTIMIVGMAVNLAIVLLANARSQRRQDREYTRQKEALGRLAGEISGHGRRADAVVEAQNVNSLNHAVETTLLVRQYRSTGTSQSRPLPVVRIVIPGDQLQAGGLMLEFGRMFALDAEEYASLRDTQWVFFGMFCGASEEAPAAPGVADERFTFLRRDEVPELVRLDPEVPQASYFERKLWAYLWGLMPEMPRNAKYPWVPADPGRGLKATWLKPATITVRPAHTYTAYVSLAGIITLEEDVPGKSGLLDEMVKEGAKLEP